MTGSAATVGTVVGVIAIVWGTLALSLWLRQDRIVFQPPREPQPPLPERRVDYRSADGTPAFAYEIGTREAGKPVVLAVHGNADLARWFIPWAEELAKRANVVVVVAEYRGYDGIPGPATAAGAELDMRAALAWIQSSFGASTPVIYYGHSLGAALVADLAAFAPPRVLILQSPFTSARDMAKRMFVPGLTLFWPLLSRVQYDNVSRVRALDAPVWVAHGEQDRLIPAEMGRSVFAAARRQGRLLTIPRATHNDVDELGGEPYWAWITAACASVRG
jgi:fermentation-respiration switch protein FrsA (DUF1100 family)